MQANDLPELERRLAELADAFASRSPSKGALKVWLDALKESRFDDVQSALTDWPKTNVRMPAPADILKACRSEVSKRMEEQQRVNALTAPTVERVLERAEMTDSARAFKRMWDAVYKRRSVESPRQWCKNVLESSKAEPFLKSFAEQSLNSMEPEAQEAKRVAARMNWSTENSRRVEA